MAFAKVVLNLRKIFLNLRKMFLNLRKICLKNTIKMAPSGTTFCARCHQHFLLVPSVTNVRILVMSDPYQKSLRCPKFFRV